MTSALVPAADVQGRKTCSPPPSLAVLLLKSVELLYMQHKQTQSGIQLNDKRSLGQVERRRTR
jgi:hypothetical protein